MLVISGIPSSSSNPFHLLIVRCGSTNKNQTDCDIRTLPVGFILANNNYRTPSDIISNHKQQYYDWIFARRYDPQTEEISNKSIDDITLNNILLALGKGGELAMTAMMGTHFIMSYEQFMQSHPPSKIIGSDSTALDSKSTSLWIARTTCITSSYLAQCHSVCHGDKIVPSSYNQELQDNNIQPIILRSSNYNTITSSSAQDNVDGIQISYPQIPCIDPSINARRLTQHSGTRYYLSNMSPETRTKLLLGGRVGGDDSFHPGEYVWNDILSATYRGNEHNFLADIQLSFLLFLFLECHTSLEHWRDSISMCSLAVTSNNHTNLLHKYPNFFQQLLSIIHDQFLSIETEFFQEVEYSSGQKNFLIQALERLCGACDDIVEDGNRDIGDLKASSVKLKRMLRDRFQLELASSLSSMNDADMEIDQECPPIVYESNETKKSSTQQTRDLAEHDFDDDEDGPVIVPYDEFESSLSRSAALSNSAQKHTQMEDVKDAKYRHEYPLLFAAMSPHEDVLMCAARVLDEQRDVSLVREAAAYLEKVEAYRCTS